jgi:hypothetical protein
MRTCLAGCIPDFHQSPAAEPARRSRAVRHVWGAFHMDKAGLKFEIGFGDFEPRGLHGDPGTAVFWYRRARDLGATGVASRLERLETKGGRN